MNVSDIPMDVYLRNGELMFWFYLRNGELMFWFWHTKSNQLGCLGHAMVIVCLSHFVFKSTEDVGATLRLVAVGPSLSMMSLHNVHKRKSEQVPQNQSLYWLVVSNMTFIFHFIWDVILPIDFYIFQDGYCTTNQYRISNQTIIDPSRPTMRQ